MNQQAKTKRSFPYVNIILVVTVALVVIILGYTLMNSIGLIGRMNNAGSCDFNGDRIKINENHMDVYRYHVAQNELYYEYMYIQYGMMSDPTGGLIKYMTANDYINYMIPAVMGSGTFDESAYRYAEQYLTYCAGAKKAGLYDTYKTEVQKDIDEYIETLKSNAEVLGVTFGSYLKNYFGSGVSKGDIETAMEYYFIGGKYAEKLTEDFSAEIKKTPDLITKYREEHKENFYSTSYKSYKLINNSLKDKFMDGDTSKKLTVDDVKTIIVDYYLDQKFEDQYKTQFKDIKDVDKDQLRADVRTTLLALEKVGDHKEVFISAHKNDPYKKAAYTVVTAISKAVSNETSKITDGTAPWADITAKDATDLQKFLFGDGRATGDCKLIETKTTSKDKDGKEVTNLSYTWYVVDEDVMVLDTEKTKNAHYLLLTDDAKDAENAKTAKEKADAFHKALTETPTSDKFVELAKQYAPNSSGALVENISYKNLETTYKELADWLYEDGRKEGDVCKIIEVKDTSSKEEKVKGYLVALYISENDETWNVNAVEAMTGDRLTEWFDAAVKEFNVSIDYEFETESTTTEETTAAK